MEAPFLSYSASYYYLLLRWVDVIKCANFLLSDGAWLHFFKHYYYFIYLHILLKT